MIFKLHGLILIGILLAMADSQSGPETNATEPILEVLTCEMLTNSPHCVKLGKKLYIIDQNNMLNWFQADRNCRQQNAHLAMFSNAEEMDAVTAYVAKFIETGARKYWLGATDLGSEGTFHETESGKPLRFARWGDSLPDSYKGAEDCLDIVSFDGKNFVMNDDSCLYLLRFICEFKSGVEESLYNQGGEYLLKRALKGNLRVTIKNPTIYITNDKDDL